MRLTLCGNIEWGVGIVCLFGLVHSNHVRTDECLQTSTVVSERRSDLGEAEQSVNECECIVGPGDSTPTTSGNDTVGLWWMAGG